MTIDEALRIFGYTKVEDLKGMDMSLHRTRYKKLIRAYHPDLYAHRDDVDIIAIDNAAKLINEANDLLEKAIISAKPLERKKAKFILISFEAYMSLYSGEVIEVIDADNNVIKLSKSNVKDNRVFLDIECNLKYDDTEIVKVWTVPVSDMDEYKVSCQIPVYNLDIETMLYLTVCNRSFEIWFPSLACEVNLVFDYGIYLTIGITRSLVDE